MTDISAAMGMAGLSYYDRVIEHRRKLFNLYRERFQRIAGISLVDGRENTYWLCTVLVERRDDFARMLFENGIDSNMVQIRNDVYKVFGGVRADLPNMNEIEDKYISIPLGMNVTEENAEYICDKIKEGW